MTELSLKVSRIINAPVKTVFNAWLDPAMLAKFMLPGEAISVPRVEVDPKVGGRFTIVMATKEQEIPHGGEYLTINPYSQIVFTWESPFSIAGSTVTINLTEQEKGTHIELTHVKFSSEEACSDHEAGWTKILESLANVVS